MVTSNDNNTIFLVLGAAFFVFITLFSLNSSKLSLTSYYHPNQTVPTTLQITEDELGVTLERVAMPNKTLIIAVINRAYVEGEVMPNMLDIFLESFWAGDGTRELLNHLMIVAVDQTAYDRCIFRGLHCYKLETEGVDFMGEQVYMSSAFINMMWRRTQILLEILERGYNFIFTDTDVIWLRNPFTVLETNATQDLDFQISADRHDGNSTSIRNPINTGFYFVKSNNKTISLFQKWYDMKNNSSGAKEQDILQKLILDNALTDLDIKFRILETRFVSGFCQDSSDIGSVLTVHANCCRYIKAKVSDLVQVLRDWGSFKVTRANVIVSSFIWSPHLECAKSWE